MPRQFCWAKNAALMSYAPEEVLYEGELLQLKGSEGEYVANRYVLTLSALIKCKVRACEDGQRSDARTGKCALRLQNPRIEKVSDSRAGL